MSSPKTNTNTSTDSTLEFYETNAEAYAQQTLDANLSSIYARFICRLPPNGRILDLGCGAGRDLKAFSLLGFQPQGIDASESLVGIARAMSGAAVSLKRIESIDYLQEFHGVWACASLLHIQRKNLSDVLGRIRSALIPGGPFFASIQEGTGVIQRIDGRLFTLYEEHEFRSMLAKSGFSNIETWRTHDSLREGRQLTWLNFIST